MVDGAIQDNQNKNEVGDNPLAGGGLIQQEVEPPGEGMPEQILKPQVIETEEQDPIGDGSLLSAGTPPVIETDDKLTVMVDEKPDPIPGDINKQASSGADNSGIAGSIPKTVKAGPLNTTLGNGVLDMDTIRNIKVNVQAVLGGVSMSVSKLSNLKEGELISLEKNIGEEIEILANGQIIAHGEIVVIEGDVPMFGITITSIIGS